MANKFFPVSIDLNNKNILVIGAGKIALRKIATLLNYNCNITVITKEVLEENLPRDPSGEDTAVDVEGDKVIMYDIYFAGDEPDELLEIKKEDLIYILDRWIKFLEKPITDENYEEIFEMEDPVVKILKDDKYVII